MTTLTPPAKETEARLSSGRIAAENRDMDALLDLLEERGVDPPSVKARGRTIVTAAVPRAATASRRVAAAGRRVAEAASVAALLVLVSLLAVLIATAETVLRAVAACDLPGRGRTCARTVAAWDVPGRARSWRGRARAWADHILAWPAEIDRRI